MASRDSFDKISDNPARPAETRRWSRNFSANRQRELERLNQIEHRRQLLELRRHNDLLDQMSFTVNNLKITNNSKLVSLDNSAHVTPGEPTEGNESVGATNYCDQMAVTNLMDDRAQLDQAVELKQSRSWAPEGRQGDGAEKPMNRADDQKPSQTGKNDLIVAGGDKTVEEDDVINLGVTMKQSASGRGVKRHESTSSVDQLTNDQLISFISSCVPKNKRVLCLIVRDKVSKLNQAKSYFYPTYYLFIQAIIDIDDHLIMDSLVNTDAPNEDFVAIRGKVLTDNSFSASSSISADMMFIGAEPNSAANTTGYANKLSGNSYSDNENNDTENEDDLRRYRIQTPDLNEKVSPEANGNTVNSDLSVYPDRVSSKRKNLHQGLQNLEHNFRNKATKRHEHEELCDEIEEDDMDDDESDIGECHERDYQSNELLNRSTSTCSKDNTVDGRITASFFDNNRNPYTGTYGVLLSGRKRKKAKTYLIGPGEQGYTRKNSICKLKSNVLGTQFNAIRLNHAGNDDRCTIASINYETNVLGFKGPRKMRVFLVKDENLASGTKNLSELHKRYPSSVVQLKNMTPSWNVESQSYVLNFHGRVTQASVKNFQLVECEDEHQVVTDNLRLLSKPYPSNLENPISGPNGYKQQQSAQASSSGDPAASTSSSTTMAASIKDGQRTQTAAGHPTLLQQQMIVKRSQLLQQHQHLSSTQDAGGTHHANRKDQPINVLIEDNNNTMPAFDGPILASSSNPDEQLQPSVARHSGQLVEQNNDDTAAVMFPKLQQRHKQQNSNYLDNIVAGSSHKSLLAYERSIVMQFGRISNHEFTCDVTYPLSILQAFSIALSSFDSKLACE